MLFLFSLYAPENPESQCGTWELRSSLKYARSLAAACKLLVGACGFWFPHQGSNPSFLHWEHGLLATGPPRKSPHTWSLEVINTHLLSHCSVNQKSRYSVAYPVVVLDSYRPVNVSAGLPSVPENLRKNQLLSLLLMAYWFKSVPHSCRTGSVSFLAVN